MKHHSKSPVLSAVLLAAAACQCAYAAPADEPRRLKRGEPGWFEWMDFHREAYRKYLRHYLTEVNKTHPDFQLCSNWAFMRF